MIKEPIEVVLGSGNAFRDFDYPDADVRQAKAIMGAQIIKIVDKRGLSTRQAEAQTGISHKRVFSYPPGQLWPLYYRSPDGDSLSPRPGGGNFG